MENDNISAAAFHRFISQPASGRSSALPLLAAFPNSPYWYESVFFGNACAENFFSLLKTELLYLQEFDSVEQFIAELHAYIEWYNNKRIKLTLNGLSPIEYRLMAA